VDLLKVDAEEAEPLVLHGALGTLVRWQPTVIFEVNFEIAERSATSPHVAWQLLEGQGYLF
jgi:hypothetical protein